jgi:hypothetical protein
MVNGQFITLVLVGYSPPALRARNRRIPANWRSEWTAWRPPCLITWLADHRCQQEKTGKRSNGKNCFVFTQNWHLQVLGTKYKKKDEDCVENWTPNTDKNTVRAHKQVTGFSSLLSFGNTDRDHTVKVTFGRSKFRVDVQSFVKTAPHVYMASINHGHGLKKNFDLFLTRKIKLEHESSTGCFTVNFRKKVPWNFLKNQSFVALKVRPGDGTLHPV